MVLTLLNPAVVASPALKALVPSSVISPISVARLAALLRYHPDQTLATYLVSGFTFGFSLGVHGVIRSGSLPNLASSRLNPEAVSAAIAKEVSRGHSHGPFPHPPFSLFHAAPLGLVAKKTGDFRLILDFSVNHDLAVNAGIDLLDFPVRYCSFDDAVALVREAGPSAFMAKLDIKHAFRLCPVRPSDWPLLCFHWQGSFYFDSRLPFGLRSSPFIFNTLADALQWCCFFFLSIACLIHYLDDFFLCYPSRDLCASALSNIVALFSHLGVPLAPAKVVGPLPVLTFLGIEIDAPLHQIRLPSDKFEALMLALTEWEGRSRCTKRQLLSLIGHLSFAAKVVKPGRLFLRRLITLSSSVTELSHHIYLSADARADIRWWLDFLPSWNGVSVIPPPPVSNIDLHLFTDASSHGIGGWFRDSWFSFPLSRFSALPCKPDSFNITFWELFALVVAVFTWSDRLRGREVVLNTDNEALVFVWSNGSRHPAIMRLVRSLFSRSASLSINLLFHHIPGTTNVNADLLSRLQVDHFLHINPGVAPAPAQLPAAVWDI